MLAKSDEHHSRRFTSVAVRGIRRGERKKEKELQPISTESYKLVNESTAVSKLLEN